MKLKNVVVIFTKEDYKNKIEGSSNPKVQKVLSRITAEERDRSKPLIAFALQNYPDFGEEEYSIEFMKFIENIPHEMLIQTVDDYEFQHYGKCPIFGHNAIRAEVILDLENHWKYL